jgi:hypothetical protein
MTTPGVVVFDVNETLSDMAPMAARFAEVGAPELMAKIWFASLLRDGFALTAAGASGQFSVIGAGTLRSVLSGAPLAMDMDSAVQHVMDGFSALAVHPDVPEGSEPSPPPALGSSPSPTDRSRSPSGSSPPPASASTSSVSCPSTTPVCGSPLRAPTPTRLERAPPIPPT